MVEETRKADIGMVGLAVMGRNLALNIADHGFTVAVWNHEQPVTDAFLAEYGAGRFVGTRSLVELVAALERPRLIWMMIKAGNPVDQVLGKLAGLLDPGDVVADGGNTDFRETRSREVKFKQGGMRFVGMGVSGGEEGARRGPALMVGGEKPAWEALAPILQAIAARTESGACVTHVGADGAGHFVKMVHNGIEYGDMQLIAETYDLLSRGLGFTTQEVSEIFARWNRGPLASFLVELTAKVLSVKDSASGLPLVDLVEDRAGGKGTGKWAAEIAADLEVSIPTLVAALEARWLSGMKDQRVVAAGRIRGVTTPRGADGLDRETSVNLAHDALLASKICCYAQGLDLIRAGSGRYGWGISLAEMARIWKGGCIIRARLLDGIMGAFERAPDLSNLLCDQEVEQRLDGLQSNWRRVVSTAQGLGIPVPAMSASLTYFDSYRRPHPEQS